MDAWEQAIAPLRKFRQGENEGRKGRNGPSLWPEPDAIRLITSRRPKGAAPTKAFPRAAFGLPIIFHFPQRGEPPQTELYPFYPDGVSCGRMASSLVIKPLVLQSGRALPIILRLDAPLPEGLGLRDTESRRELLADGVDGSAIVGPKLASIVQPLARSRTGSAVDAFLAYAIEQGFQEVTQ